jgi:hypothetical protein
LDGIANVPCFEQWFESFPPEETGKYPCSKGIYSTYIEIPHHIGFGYIGLDAVSSRTIPITSGGIIG